ncbi:MAG TPA: carbohydrate binding domain-containing protein [Dictyoglomaceae bacterium]|nr:carbohydrate binding domain-containing protein [Dictyoglomaceae bacterium]
MVKKVLSILVLSVFLMVMVSGCAPKEETPLPEENQPVISTDFEDGSAQGWQPRGGEVTITPTTAVKHTGEYSLYVSGRNGTWHGAQIEMLKEDGAQYLQPNKAYSISIWVYQESGTSEKLTLTMERKNNDGSTDYDSVVYQKDVPDKTWVELSKSYTVPATATYLLLYVESPTATLSYYIDDLVIYEQ